MLCGDPVKPCETRQPIRLPGKKKGSAPGRRVDMGTPFWRQIRERESINLIVVGNGELSTGN
jgi:hypothetical protein